MGRAGVLQEIRKMRFEVLLERHERGELSQVEAAELLEEAVQAYREALTERTRARVPLA